MNDLNARSKTIAAIGARIETTNNPHPRTGKKKKKKKTRRRRRRRIEGLEIKGIY
jgi:hypothetical protein